MTQGNTKDAKPAKRLLFSRGHTRSSQLSISVHPRLADDVESALAFLMSKGSPDNGDPYNKSEATYMAIIEHAQARGWRPDNGGSA